MALYIKPPKAGIGFNKLCNFVKKRLLFLHFLKGKSVDDITTGIQQETLTADSECLIEGSAKDEISHFILRFLSAEDLELTTFFVQSEVELFAYRLNFYDRFEIKRMLKKASKQSVEISNHQYIVKPYKDILTTLILIANDFELSLENNKYLKVPFASALDFVKNRLHPLHAGCIEVPYHEINSLLTLVFKELLIQGINQMRSSSCINELKDPRLCYMQQEIKTWFHMNIAVPDMILPKKFISEVNLDNESLNFPLCMANLHILLRKNHRLQHSSRVQYILFLKEIGVPYSEVVKLFMKEYSIPLKQKLKSTASNCNHSWDDSKKRYIYSIEHLYGKQGSGKNYKAHSCNTLQSFRKSSTCQGGCPFVCFEEEHVKSTFTSNSCEVPDIEDIKNLVGNEKFTDACYTYLVKKMETHRCPTSKTCIKQTAQHNKIIFNTNNCQISEKNFFSVKVLDKHNILQKRTLSSKPSSFYFILRNH